jgi:plasmid maintenance system antidote protein VapI
MSLETPVADAVAAELCAALARRHITHAELARRVGRHERTVNRALRGDTPLTLDAFVTLTAALGAEDAADRASLAKALQRALVTVVQRQAAA